MKILKNIFCIFTIVLLFLFVGKGAVLEVHGAAAEPLTALSQLSAKPNGNFYLTGNITAPADWTPIDDFSGTIDGRGFLIVNLKVGTDTAGVAGAGLFKTLSGSVKNLGFSNAQIYGTTAAETGVIAAGVTGSVINCYAINSAVYEAGTLVTSPHAGLAGGAFVLPGNCYYNSGVLADLNAAVEQTDSAYLIRWENDTAAPSLKLYALPTGGDGASIASPYILKTQQDFATVAALVANKVSAYDTAYYALGNNLSVAGLIPIGTQAAPFKGKFNGNGYVLSGSFGANSDGDAGVFGTVQDAEIQALGVSGTVSGSYSAGGIAGRVLSGTQTKITRCYFNGTVTSSAGNSGGLVGTVSGPTTISSCYSLGTPLGGTWRGGLIGYADALPTLKNSYTIYNNVCGYNVLALTSPTAHAVQFQSGVSKTDLADMRKGTFANTLNTGNSDVTGGAVFGAILGRTPVLIGVGEGIGASLPFQVTLTAPANGTLKAYANSLEVSDKEYVAKGATLTVQATPATGYDVASIKADAQVLTTSATTVAVAVNGPITLSAEFKAYKAYKVKVTANTGGTVSPSDTVEVREGTQQVFTIIPNSDCRIKSVTYTGSSITQSGNTFTTGIVTRDETLTVVFVSKADGIKDIVVTTDGDTIVTVKALENVAEQVYGNEGNTIRVAMDKSTVVDSDTLQALRGYNVNLLLDMKNYSWRINGLTVASSASSVNLGTTVGASTLSADLMKKFAAYADTTQLDLTYTGAFPFTGYLTFTAPGKDSATKYATLFYYNEYTENFETIGTERVADDGTVTYRFSHASRYVVVVYNRPLSVQDLAVGAGAVDKAKPLTLKATDIAFASILFGGVIIGGLVLLGVIRKTGRAR